jgi:competence protein ComEA
MIVMKASIIIRGMDKGVIEKLAANPYWLLISGILIGLASSAIIVLLSSPPRGPSIDLLPAPTDAPLVVHVSGAVLNPGLYEMEAGSRTHDAIEMAGGALIEADLGRVNLALELRDGQQIVVPAIGELISESGFPININRAEVAELTELPGIGPVSAQAIVDYRFQNGPFVTIEGLVDVPGIGSATFEQIKDLIDIQG